MKIYFAFLCFSLISACAQQNLAEGACPIGWKSFEDACYAAFKGAGNFNYWEGYCVSQGGHLASIHSYDESRAITGLLSGNAGYYIGLHDITTEGRWQYTDGTSVNYYNWNSGEPSGQTDEDCIAITSNGKWYDERCSTLYGAICKRGIGCDIPFSLDTHLIILPSLLFYENNYGITYTCEEGYKLEGESTARCVDGEFDPPEVPECVETLQCYTWQKVVCDPSSVVCDTSGNRERTVEACDETVEKCFVHHYTIPADNVLLDANSGGCVTADDVALTYGCYSRSYLETIDPSGAEELSRLEEDLGAQSDDVEVCVCDRDICNESVETASRNDAITSATKLSWVLTSMITIAVWQI